MSKNKNKKKHNHPHRARAHRFARTGRAGFSGPELQIAEAAATVFDELVQLDRHGFARTAALWSIQQMAALLKSAAGAMK